MRKQKTITIEGKAYHLSQLGAVEGRRLVLLLLRLLGRFAPLLASAKNALDKDALESIGDALAAIDPKELEPLWDAFARHAYVVLPNGKLSLHEQFDEHFAGEYFAMTQFFIESARFNFGDFLAKAFATANAPTDAEAPTS